MEFKSKSMPAYHLCKSLKQQLKILLPRQLKPNASLWFSAYGLPQTHPTQPLTQTPLRIYLFSMQQAGTPLALRF